MENKFMDILRNRTSIGQELVLAMEEITLLEFELANAKKRFDELENKYDDLTETLDKLTEEGMKE